MVWICGISFWKFIFKFIILVFTIGGNANGRPCRFPFKYNNVLHYQCTYEDAQNFNNKRWCRTNEDTAVTLEWGNCPGKLYKKTIRMTSF